MNLLKISEGGYNNKVRLLKILLFIGGILLAVPSAHTNYLFFDAFFDGSEKVSFCAAAFVELLKVVGLATAVKIYFTETENYLDGVSLGTFVFALGFSIFFSYEGDYIKSLETAEEIHQTDSTNVQPIATLSETATDRDKRKHLTAAAAIISLQTAEEEKKAPKKQHIEQLKKRIDDNFFLFLILSEFFAVFCCVSVVYLNNKSDNENKEEDYNKKLLARYRSAIGRKNPNQQLIDKLAAEINEKGLKLPKTKST